jgi:hypothetical protein
MKSAAINQIGNASGAAAATSGAVGGLIEFYPAISLSISAATFLVFLVFKWLHYQLAKKHHDKNSED